MVKSECQRLLTVGMEACGGVLERLQRGVGLEGLGQLLDARGVRVKFTLIVIVATE